MTPLVLAFSAALTAQYNPPPYTTPYVQPPVYAHPGAGYRAPAYVPPTLPPGSPSLMIQPAPITPLPAPYQSPAWRP